MSSPQIRVVVVDDHELVRNGFISLLRGEEGIDVVGQAGDGIEALQVCSELNPDIVLMDIVMPSMDGIQATELLKTRCPSTKVIALSGLSDETQLMNMRVAGAVGHLKKTSRLEDVRRMMDAAMAGLLPPLEASAPVSSPPSEPPPHITQREAEVLGLLGRGKSNREIARVLNIREATARTHVSRILGKLNLTSRTEAALYAVHRGLAGAPPVPSSPPVGESQA